MRTSRCKAMLLVMLLSVGLISASAEEERVSFPITIEWIDLMPAHILATLDNLPMLEHDYADDGPDPFSPEWDDPYAEVWNAILTSTEVVETFADRLIRIPGFIVPLEIDDRHQVQSFFVVPYFGACIHVPPPPPNQLIYVADASAANSGLTLQSMYTPFWLIGTLRIQSHQHELGLAAYTLELSSISEYRWGS